MQYLIIGASVLVIIYLVGLFLTHQHWSKYMNENKINLCPEEVQIIVPMLFMWFFYWDGIGVIMNNAAKFKTEETE